MTLSVALRYQESILKRRKKRPSSKKNLGQQWPIFSLLFAAQTAFGEGNGDKKREGRASKETVSNGREENAERGNWDVREGKVG